MTENVLGTYLKDRRERLDPASFGFAPGRRRTPGLRREEVAQMASVSPTWYTWLEQGRGGAPSASVLDRIAHALMLTDVEREHVFLLGLGRPPEVKYQASEGISPRLQRVLDSLEYSPAMVKTSIWDILAWNQAATAVMRDYGQLAATERNVLRMMFCDPDVGARQTDWEGVARFVVATFRADIARAGATDAAQALIEELSHASPEFVRIWRDNDVRVHGEGTKNIRHRQGGTVCLEYSAFAVDGRPDLSLVIYSPATEADKEVVRSLIAAKAAG